MERPDRSLRDTELFDFGSGPVAYERWRGEALAPRLFDIDVDPASFRNDFSRTWLGASPLVTFDQAGARYERTAAQARRDGVDAIWLQTVETGGVDAVSPIRDIHMRSGMSALCDLSRPVRQETFPGTGRILVLPRDAFEGALPSDTHGLQANGARHAILNDYLDWLARAPSPGTWPSEGRLITSMAAVVLACFSPGASVPDAAASALRSVTLRRAVHYIDANVGDADLHVAQVARAVGVSRATLYRAAATAGGVDALIFERRLQAARRALSDPSLPGRIAQVAELCGFRSAGHFSTRFKERFGFSPRHLRPF